MRVRGQFGGMAEGVGLTSSVSALRAPARTVVFEIVGSIHTLGEAEIGPSVTLVAEGVGLIQLRFTLRAACGSL